MNMNFRFTLSLLLVLLLPVFAGAESPVLQPRIVDEFPHNTATSTQGLFFHDGLLYESSGGFSESFLAIVQPDTGQHILTHPVPNHYFAEGITPVRNALYVLTWKSGIGFIHDLENLEPLSRFSYCKDSSTEGWGLTTDGTRFIRSSGTSRITFHNVSNFAPQASIQILNNGKPVRMLNELEMVEELLFANIWKSDTIAVIDLNGGHVVAWIDLSALRHRIAPGSGTANGIAYDPATSRIFVTGKHWDKLFVIEVDGLPETTHAE